MQHLYHSKDTFHSIVEFLIVGTTMTKHDNPDTKYLWRKVFLESLAGRVAKRYHTHQDDFPSNDHGSGHHNEAYSDNQS